jgi:glycosyltransferase involved in cell wall biosynthesis
MPNPKMKIAVVTTFPPGTGSLNEYAYHFVRYLRLKLDVSEIVLLTDELPAGQSYPEHPLREEAGAAVIVDACWRFNDTNNPTRILGAIRKHHPDVVLYNLQFATFGDRKIPATLGLMTPALTRAMGIKTITLMHNLMDTIDLKSAGFGGHIEKVMRLAGAMVTRALLKSDLVAVTIPKYVELLEEKYGATNVVLMPHGAFVETAAPAYQEQSSQQSIMTFGKFGTYKKVEPLIEAFKLLQADHRPHLELVIAGTNSPNAPQYLDDLQEQYKDVQGLHFTGYVAEEDVPQVFGEATVVAFPYNSTTGSSGVLHQAGEYGKAVVLPHIGDFAEVIAEEGYTGKFFEADNVSSLAQAIASLLDNAEERNAIGQQNYIASRGLPISEVVDWYLVHFQQLLNNNVA